MKKHLILLTAIFTFLISNVFAQTVHVTNTGKKYHAAGCRYLSKSDNTIDLSDAKTQGYEPCSVCSPNTTVKGSTTTPSSGSKNTTTKSSDTSVQCLGTTQKGTRCKHMTRSPNGRCYQHGGN